MLKALSAFGAGTALLGRSLSGLAQENGSLTTERIAGAEWLTGMSYDDDERQLMLSGCEEILSHFDAMRAVAIDNGVAPAFRFDPEVVASGIGAVTPGDTREAVRRPAPADTEVTRPAADDELAFMTVAELGALLRDRRLSSVELTRLYLSRLREYDPVLRCVITLTEDLALEQARRADAEIAAGRYRGPLHGIPWGAKDIISVPGYRTTWGAAPYRNQVRSETAQVAARLADAGAVLTAKLSVGALAWGDVWFDATTKNPWNTEQGSSGSSAGSASATAAGLVGFAIGTETWGSIVSPCTRCGTSGLRPTFGRVSRHGVMALSWSMDKIGPIARSAEDCALIFAAIHGADRRDPSAVDRPFSWPEGSDPRALRVGYVPALFDEDRGAWVPDDPEADPWELGARRARMHEWAEFDRRTLEELRAMGFELVPIELPETHPVEALAIILIAEAATAFDELTRSGRDDLLVRQIENAWPNVFRQAQLIPAVEYIRANRIRSMLMTEMERVMAEIDVFVAPSFAGNHLLMTNLTGHPSVVLPNGFRTADGTPTSITFTGGLHRESALLAVANEYQRTTDYHRRHPQIEPTG
jgi:Asp-tRNA(Asn)/Glu-tRNA(Gln) amidotransferase A subunit family amidase